MACVEFADLLVDYQELAENERREVDAHVSLCPECQEFRNALADMDTALIERYSGLEPSTTLQQIVQTQAPLKRPSFVPLILDLAGGLAVLIIALVLAEVLLPGSVLNALVYWIASAGFAASSLFIAYRSYADLKH